MHNSALFFFLSICWMSGCCCCCCPKTRGTTTMTTELRRYKHLISISHVVVVDALFFIWSLHRFTCCQSVEICWYSCLFWCYCFPFGCPIPFAHTHLGCHCHCVCTQYSIKASNLLDVGNPIKQNKTNKNNNNKK